MPVLPIPSQARLRVGDRWYVGDVADLVPRGLGICCPSVRALPADRFELELCAEKKVVLRVDAKLVYQSSGYLGFELDLPRDDRLRDIWGAWLSGRSHRLPARLLLIEPEAPRAAWWARRLRSAGVEVHLAKDWASAERLCRRIAFDAALVDWLLPPGTAEAVIAGLRAGYPETSVVACSALNHSSALRRAFRAMGAASVLPKPVPLGALRACLDRLSATPMRAERAQPSFA